MTRKNTKRYLFLINDRTATENDKRVVRTGKKLKAKKIAMPDKNEAKIDISRTSSVL